MVLRDFHASHIIRPRHSDHCHPANMVHAQRLDGHAQRARRTPLRLVLLLVVAAIVSGAVCAAADADTDSGSALLEVGVRAATTSACVFPGQSNTVEPITPYEPELMAAIAAIRAAGGAANRKRPRDETEQPGMDRPVRPRVEPARRIVRAQRALQPQTNRAVTMKALVQVAASASASASTGALVPAAVIPPINDLNLLRTTLVPTSAVAALAPVGLAAPLLSHAGLHGFTYLVESAAPHRVVRVFGPVNVAMVVGTNPSNEATWFCDATSTPTPVGPGGALVPFHLAFVQRQRTAWQTGHIIAASLGGDNVDPLNFFTQSVQSNNQGGRRGRAERMAAFVQQICPGMVVEVDTDFAYTNLPAVAALTLTPGANDLIPTGGSFSISVQLLDAPVGPAAAVLAGCGGQLRGLTYCNSAPGTACQAAGVATAGSVPPGFQWIHVRRFWRHAACAVRGDGTTWCTWTTPWSNDYNDDINNPLRGVDAQFVA